MVLVPPPAGQRGAHDPHRARTVDAEIAIERPEHDLGRLLVGQVRVAVVEDRLPVDVAEVILAFVLHHALGRQLGVQRRAGDGRVEHELVEVGIVADGVVDRLVDVFRRVVFQADDGRAQHADAVRLQFADQREGVDAGEFGVLAVACLRCPSTPRRCPGRPVARWCRSGARWPS